MLARRGVVLLVVARDDRADELDDFERQGVGARGTGAGGGHVLQITPLLDIMKYLGAWLFHNLKHFRYASLPATAA
ncbi:hypothetical protein GCM10010277_24170 [Streptomyces longisporoflavus]|nr:hypothetical protein GCM10010277_24170 [Streptomyces longisporoflavus]